ncbi:MAG: glucosamine-6-phosphate deaminase [Alistipes ihumii]
MQGRTGLVRQRHYVQHGRIRRHSERPSRSYHSFMWNNFSATSTSSPKNVNILNGNAPDLEKECADYEARIEKAGGIDLFMGGIGSDGHLAFNEAVFVARLAHAVKSLTKDTIIANSRFFGHDVNLVPKTALTVGVATVMSAREVLILAFGHNKARALAAGIEGGYSHQWTISALQVHPKGIIVCDEDATDELKVGTYKYFKDIEAKNLDPASLGA